VMHDNADGAAVMRRADLPFRVGEASGECGECAGPLFEAIAQAVCALAGDTRRRVRMK